MVNNLATRILATLILLLTLTQLFAQEQKYFVIAGKITTDSGGTDGATITVTKNDTDTEIITPPRTGRFRFEFEYNNEYELRFEKEGFFKKIIVISSHVPQQVWDRNNEFPPFSFIVNLFKALPGIDNSFTNKPVGRVFYNASIDNFDSEVYFSDIQIEEQIEEATNQNKELSAEQREINRANKLDQEKREADYDKTIRDANDLYQKQQLEEALEKYNYASGLFPDRPYPKDRIAELQDLIAAKKLAEQRQQEQMAQYQKIIDQADGLYINQQFDRAKQLYQDALAVKPGDAYAVGRIDESDKRFKQQQTDLQYQNLIADADQSFQASNHQTAREKYLQAAALKPGESYPQSQVKKIDEEMALQSELAEIEQRYQDAMKQGDAAFNAQEYNPALVAYRKALDIRANDPLAKNKVDQVESIILQQENQANYSKHIQDADIAFNQGDWARAKSLYQEALKHQPNETYPSQQIAEIDRRVKQDEDFNLLMNLANDSFTAGDFEQAKSLYLDARKIRDDEQINNRIREIDRLLANKELDERYASLIGDADNLFIGQELEKAKDLYSQASALKPIEQYPKNQLIKIEEEIARLADAAEKESRYQAAMQQGNQAYSGEQYQLALEAYQRALANKENDALAQQRISQTQEMIAFQEKRSRYDQQIASADQAFDTENWQNARSLYEQALVILPDENYPKNQISRIDQIISLNEQFEQYMSEALTAFNAENYQQSKGYYQQAFNLKNQPEITDRISEIDQIVEQKEQDRIKEQERLAALDQAYQAAIDKGNGLLTGNTFDEARAAYGEAKNLKPNESLPDQLIEKANSLQAAWEQQLAEEKAREEARLRALQQEKEQSYNRAVQMGDSLFAASQLEFAKIQFESATKIKPEESYPIERIKVIDDRIQELARIRASYNEAVEAGNEFVRLNQYVQALAKFNEALTYLPGEEYPKTQIDRLTKLIEQQEQAEQLQRAYLAAVQSGDSLFVLSELQNSRARFVEASGLKPNESYPRNKIREIDAALNQLAQEKARQEAVDQSYQSAIQTADQAFAGKDFNLARTNYNEASRIKPSEKYPKDQLAKIDQLLKKQVEDAYNAAIARADRLFAEENYTDSKLAYNEALGIKVNDQYSSNQIRKIDQLLAQLAREQKEKEELESSYSEKIRLADLAFRSNQYQNAKEAYQEALLLKPEELFPAEQITKIDSILVELKRQDEINQLYSQAMRDGQAAYIQNEFQKAIGFFQQALTHKPDEPLPKQRIAEIESMIAKQEEIARLAQLEEEQQAARLKALQDKYDAAVASGDQAFNQEQFGQARDFYTQALDAKPDENYPKKQIAEIDRIVEERAVAEMQQKQQAYQDSLKKALETAYDLKIAQAEKNVSDQSFESAIVDFEAAIQILPEKGTEVSERINQVRQQMRELQELQANYQNAIARADQYYQNNDWQNALGAYEEALRYKPGETYPLERARYIRTTIQAVEEKYVNAISEADRFFADQDWYNAKDKYTEALGIKKNESYPSQQLVIVNQKIREEQEVLKKREMADEAYKEAIASGEQAMLNDKLSAARMHFEFAKELKPQETYPDQKIKEIDDLMAQKARDEALALQQNMVDDQYRQMISQADNSFKLEKYQVAKTQYNQALSIKPEEDYPKNQILIIDRILNDREAETVSVVPSNETNRKVTEPAITRPTNNSYNTTGIASEYDNSIRMADQAYMQKDYTVAQFYYYKALKEQPDSSYAKSRIKEIATLIDQTMLATELAGYREAIRKADEELSKRNYSIARFYYYQALEIKSWEQYPKDRIEEIRRLTNSMLSQREEEAYRDLIAKADEAYFKKELSVARSYYNQSLNIKKDERYPQIKLRDIDKLVEQELRNAENQEYRNILAEGDKAFYANNYSIARFYYNKALGMKPNETYPKEQLQKIKDLVSNKQ